MLQALLFTLKNKQAAHTHAPETKSLAEADLLQCIHSKYHLHVKQSLFKDILPLTLLLGQICLILVMHVCVRVFVSSVCDLP